MKKLICFVLITMMLCVISVVNQVNAEGLPESVQKQSRKDAIETETWRNLT